MAVLWVEKQERKSKVSKENSPSIASDIHNEIGQKSDYTIATIYKYI